MYRTHSKMVQKKINNERRWRRKQRENDKAKYGKMLSPGQPRYHIQEYSAILATFLYVWNHFKINVFKKSYVVNLGLILIELEMPFLKKTFFSEEMETCSNKAISE